MRRNNKIELQFCSCIDATIQKKYIDDLEKDINDYAIENNKNLTYHHPLYLFEIKQPAVRIQYADKIGKFIVELRLTIGRTKKDFDVAIKNFKKLASKKESEEREDINGWIKNLEEGKENYSKQNRNRLFLRINFQTIGKISQKTMSSKNFLNDFVEANDVLSLLDKYKWNYKGRICVYQSFNKDEFKITTPFPLPYPFSLDTRTENLMGRIMISGLKMTFCDSPIGLDIASFEVENRTIQLTTKYNYKAKTLGDFLHKNFDLCEMTRKFFTGSK